MSETGHGGGTGTPHIANWVAWIAQGLGEGNPIGQWLHRYEDLVFAGIVAMGLCLIAWTASRRPRQVPTGWQNAVELLVQGLNSFIEGIMGPHAKRFAPFIGTLFLYIWAMNLAGLIPGFKSPTANLNTTFGLALCVFLYIQFTGIRSFGLKGYLAHMMESPKDLMMFAIGLIFILPVHLLGELVKPLSLAMRLGFNITGEDAFLAVAVGFGPFGLILQLMAMGLGLILGTAQALVFSTLSAVFISMMLPHGEEHA
ncbi:MAG: F0F1 ATP synthase subunit A [Candidatus Omnitrophica bacterium]|nr:F0F1 ATP synthase subunit A [Candidatus Omnitrophota bacterium]